VAADKEGIGLARSVTVLSLNPAIDRTVVVPGFRTGATNRVVSSRLDPGGKGINVARVIRALGAPVQLLGFLGEGNQGLITAHLAEQAIPHQFVRVAGETRINLKIADPDTGTVTEINDTGFAVDVEHLTQLTDLVRRQLPETAVLVLCGSLPPGVPPTVYRDLITMAQAAGVPAILDADGPALALGLEAGPALIKPNLAEAERLLNRSLPQRADVVCAAHDLRERGAGAVVISAGADGAVLAHTEGCWWATPPAIRPGSTVGAGDSMVAGLAVGLLRGLAPEAMLALATAAAAGTASLPGTQTCSEADVARLLPQVRMDRCDPRTSDLRR
jgi:1-phosphofructokinase